MEIIELSEYDVDAVSGGALPLAVVAVGKGFLAGFTAGSIAAAVYGLYQDIVDDK